MKKIILLIALSMVMSISFTYAQVKVQVVDENAQTEQSKKEVHGVMSVKMNPLLFFRGDIPLYFEMTLTSQFAIELGAGVTISDYLWQSYLYDDLYTTVVNPELGWSGRIGLRYYAANYGYQPEGLYFALDYRIQRYNSTLKSVGSITALNQDLSRINNDVRFTLGYVKYWGDNFFIEPYAGFGIRSSKIDVAVPDELSNTVSVNPETRLMPNLSLGAKIGIWF